MGSHTKKFFVVCLQNEWGFQFEPFSQLREIVESTEPSYWEFMNPGTVLTYFIANKENKAKVEEFIGNVKNLIRDDQGLQKISIGQSEGELVVETTFWGKIKSSPLGLAVTEAINNAKKTF
jgi:hypothetical protein